MKVTQINRQKMIKLSESFSDGNLDDFPSSFKEGINLAKKSNGESSIDELLASLFLLGDEDTGLPSSTSKLNEFCQCVIFHSQYINIYRYLKNFKPLMIITIIK